MPASTPSFWYKKRGLIAFLLWPFSLVYQLGHHINQSIFKVEPYVSTIPVICIGNAVAGGAGKTPTVVALISLLKKNNKNPFIVTRGYGRNETHSKLVNLQEDVLAGVGDEALLLAQYAPTVVGYNRATDAKIAEENGADIIIMDDGLFNNTLHKNMSVLVVDREMDFGNGLTLPAGPLRTPLKKILPKIDTILTIGPSFYSDKPVFEASIAPDLTSKKNGSYIGFAGIGYPQKFRTTLEEHDYHLIDFHAFADHHRYTEKDLQPLLEEAKNKNARLITTEKDFVRLPAQYKEMVDTLPIELEIHEEKAFLSFLKNSLKEKK